MDKSQASMDEMRLCEFYLRKIRTNDSPWGGLVVTITGASDSVYEDRWGFHCVEGVVTNK